VKPHTAGEDAPTHGSNVASFHVEVPSAGLLLPFGCCPRLHDYEIWRGICVSGRGGNYTDSEHAIMGLRNH
jgi:hypothetical protein